MLTKLGDTLGDWAPRSSGGDPLTAVRAAWTALVGADVARAAQPVAITGETLVVVTASSAWSHQLAFLEPQIVRGIRDVGIAAAVTRLRFRVGTIRRPAGGRGRDQIARQPASAERKTSPPRSPAEALARFRAAVERVRAAHADRGGRFCAVCSAPIVAGDRCTPCADWLLADLRARCQRLLFDAPWLRPEEVLEMLPGLEAAAYDAIRRQLLRSWWDEMSLARKRAMLPRAIAPDRIRLRKIASSFVLLETKLDPHRLQMDSPIRRNALGELYDFIRSVEQG